MLQSEFHNLTGIVVSPEEYQHIEAVYMASDMSKIAFCKSWRRMNADRIKAYQTEQKRIHQDAINRWNVGEICWRLKGCDSKVYDSPLSDHISKTEYKLLASLGFNPDQMVWAIIYKMMEYAKMA